jgi:hypothetical protein
VRQGILRVGGSGLRIVVAVTAALAVAVGFDVDQPRAQLPTIEVPGVISVQPTAPAPTVTSPTLPSLQVTPPSVTVPKTPVTPEVKVELPRLQTPAVTVPQAPSVKAPSVVSPKPSAPQVGAEPQADLLGGTGSRSGDSQGGSDARRGDGQGSGDARAGGGSPPPATGSRAADESSADGGGSLGTVGGSAPAATTRSGAARAAARRGLSPAQRRLLLRRTPDRPLHGEQLRRLRDALAQYGGCLDAATPRGGRVLRLRAGIGPGPPLGRRAIAQRLGVSQAQALQSERTALRRLAGGCGDAAATASAGADGARTTTGATASRAATSTDGAGPADRAGTDDSGGASSGSSDDRRRAARPDGLLDTDRTGTDALAVAVVLLIVLVSLALGALGLVQLRGDRAGERQTAVPVPPTRGRRPLLFVSATGLVSMQRPPPGQRSEGAGHGNGDATTGTPSYVSERARELVGRLATSFDLVLIVGWRQDANRLGRMALDDRELPLLAARTGSPDSKLRGVARLARNRPVAWVDRELGDGQLAWADRRSSPTLLVEADEEALAEEPLVALLDDWAERVTHGETPQQRLVSQP